MFSLLTWNIALNKVSYSAPDDWDADTNLVEMLQLIEEKDPDVLCLQEMPKPNFGLRFVDYHPIPAIESHSGYTSVFLKKSKFEIIEYGQFSGGVLAKIKSKDGDFYISSIHLFPFKDNDQPRLQQLAQILLYVAQHENLPLIISGDSNMREAETKKVLSLDLKDAFFEAKSPKEHKFSWNSKMNIHSEGGFPFSARFDRIFIRDFNVLKFELTANTPVSENSTHFLSDHFALYVELDISKSSGNLDEFF